MCLHIIHFLLTVNVNKMRVQTHFLLLFVNKKCPVTYILLWKVKITPLSYYKKYIWSTIEDPSWVKNLYQLFWLQFLRPSVKLWITIVASKMLASSLSSTDFCGNIFLRVQIINFLTKLEFQRRFTLATFLRCICDNLTYNFVLGWC